MNDKRRNIMAVICQSGASNERRVAMSLVEAIDEVRAEGGDAKTDPACYLILHQLVHVMTGSDLARHAPRAYTDAYMAMGDLWDRNDRGEVRMPPAPARTEVVPSVLYPGNPAWIRHDEGDPS